ncbi:MAG: ATP-binding cassette domain-containing protein [Rhodomicrobium sp.]|nr:ATP-binding cassette domain-containing protein [Rhodomicrobium sp.]
MPAIQQGRSRPSLKPLALLRPYVLHHKQVAFLALIALLMAAGATLALPYGIREMIDRGFSSENKGLINIYFAGLTAVGAVLAAASATRFYCVTWLGERIVAEVRADVFRHLTRLSPAFYERTHSGEIMSRLNADTAQIKAAVTTSVSQVLRNGVMFIGAVSFMVVTNVKLSLLVVIVIPLIVVPLILYGRTVRRYSRIAQDEVAASSAFASENLSATRTMQAFTSEEFIAGRFAKGVERSFDAAVSRTQRRAMLTGSAIFMIFGSVVGVLWYGAHDVMSGVISGGELTQFVLYSVLAAASLGELSEVWGEMQQAAGAAERLAELMAVTPDVAEPREPRPFPDHAKGEVTFDNVSFTYPLRPEQQALHNISFVARPGERVAIVGPSGAGKSTIFNLILRFYDAQHGKVFVDRVPVEKAGLEALRKRISLVSQDTIIFAESVIENIRYGTPGATDEQVKAAARAALASTFIEQLPDGYSTQLGERGVVLSGGQRQRIAIARAILKNAPILLLDEATSALDQESEKLVQTALERVMRGRTTLVIAHRLATVMNADRILVIDGGHLVEEGTHASLINAGGVYSRLAGLQFAGPEGALAS